MGRKNNERLEQRVSITQEGHPMVERVGNPALVLMRFNIVIPDSSRGNFETVTSYNIHVDTLSRQILSHGFHKIYKGRLAIELAGHGYSDSYSSLVIQHVSEEAREYIQIPDVMAALFMDYKRPLESIEREPRGTLLQGPW